MTLCPSAFDTSGSMSGGSVSLSKSGRYSSRGSQIVGISGSLSTYSWTGTGSLSAPDYDTSENITGSVSFSGSTSSTGLVHSHIELPVNFVANLNSGSSIEFNKYYFYGYRVKSVTASSGTIENVYTLDENKNLGYLMSNGFLNGRYKYYLGSELCPNGASPTFVSKYGFIAFDFSADNFNTPTTFTFDFVLDCVCMPVKTEYQSSVGSNTVSDIQSHKLQEESNQIADDTNTTTHSIFDSITDFFGSFFDNLIHVFIPDDGYFEQWFSDLNTLLEDKLGVLYYPFAKVVQFFTLLNNALPTTNTTSCVITFPALEFKNVATNETYHFLDAQQVDLYVFNKSFRNSSGVYDTSNSSLVGTNSFGSPLAVIRLFNGIVVVFYLFSLCRQKLNLIIRGDNNDN